MNIKYKFKKFKVWFGKKTKNSLKLTEKEILTQKVVSRLLAAPSTHYLMTPSGRYYLQTEDKKYTVILQDNFVKITNHSYSFEFNISSPLSNRLILLVERKIERVRNQMESEMFENEINILNQMLK